MIGRNNPLNIRYVPVNTWLGQSGRTKGFCNFRALKYCIRAAFIILAHSYVRRGFLTYRAKIDAWAPPCENPTSNYLSYICKKCFVDPDDKPKSIEGYSVLIYYMWCFEQGKSPTLSIADIESIISDYNFVLR